MMLRISSMFLPAGTPTVTLAGMQAGPWQAMPGRAGGVASSSPCCASHVWYLKAQGKRVNRKGCMVATGAFASRVLQFVH
jgi:hypothetical protein